MCHRLLLLLLLFYQIGQAQNAESRFIEVVGYAEMEIIPDEIYYTVELKEFTENKNKVQLDTLDARFFEIINAFQIISDNVVIGDTYSRKYSVRRKEQDVFRTKTYIIKFNEIQQLDRFGQSIESIPVEKASITKLNYSKIIETEEKLKIQALENAKTKAQKLLAAVGEELGEVINVSEFYEDDIRSILNSYILYSNYDNNMGRVQSGMLNPYNDNRDIQFKKSKLSVTIKAKFKINR